MIVSAKNKTMLLCGVAFLALSASANAQSIDTTPQWDGIQLSGDWGVPNTATYGQTITPTVGQTRLSSFAFQLSQTNGTAPQYQAFVYQWDATNQRITASALFSSSVFTAPSGAAFSPVTINTGNVVLTPGQQYVLFLSTSKQQPQANSLYNYGTVANTAYDGGQFVFQNNGANFDRLSTSSWRLSGNGGLAQDLAFQAFLSATNVGENHAQAQSEPSNSATPTFAFDRSVRHKQGGTATGPLGYAAEKKLPAAVRAANAAFKALPPAAVYMPHWDVWVRPSAASTTRGAITQPPPPISTRALEGRCRRRLSFCAGRADRLFARGRQHQLDGEQHHRGGRRF